MILQDFYNLLDSQLLIEIEKLKAKNDDYILQHNSPTGLNNQKSYAFLVWFLEFYGGIPSYQELITDSKGDSSCDIIFDKTNNKNERCFYIIQSKWKSKLDGKDREKEINTEIQTTLNDFDTILQGSNRNANEKVQRKLEDLREHLRVNGEVKFIFLCLSKYNGGVDNNIKAFNKKNIKATFSVIDIEKIRLDFIDKTYKEIEPLTPLETHKNPEEELITIGIAPKSANGMIVVDKSYLLLVRPKTIWQLFSDYGFSLFYKNVRNPLLVSTFNEGIKRTAIENPESFWYYNNGITGITNSIPAIGETSELLTINGLQIINGAQTVYSIYQAYEEANDARRNIMNNEIFISFRLLKSTNKDFNLNVTRYTNSQNPVSGRDFFANDDIQNRLQQESYQYNVWYEKRAGEFRNKVPEGIQIVSNETFAQAYLAYQLQEPVRAVSLNKIFVSHKEAIDGLYEQVFNEKTNFEDMYCALLVGFDSNIKIKIHSNDPEIYSDEVDNLKKILDGFICAYLLALSKISFRNYFETKYGSRLEQELSKKIIALHQKSKQIFTNIINYTANYIGKEIQVSNTPLSDAFTYQRMRKKLEDTPFTVEELENFVPSSNENDTINQQKE